MNPQRPDQPPPAGEQPRLRSLALPPQRQELDSARRFREAWSALQSAQRLGRALARRPANAGPLNSHALVLQALDALEELAPSSARRLLEQVDAIDWLERAVAAAGARAAPRARQSATRRR